MDESRPPTLRDLYLNNVPQEPPIPCRVTAVDRAFKLSPIVFMNPMASKTRRLAVRPHVVIRRLLVAPAHLMVFKDEVRRARTNLLLARPRRCERPDRRVSIPSSLTRSLCSLSVRACLVQSKYSVSPEKGQSRLMANSFRKGDEQWHIS